MSEWTTYRQIRDALNELSEEQLDMTASIYEPEMDEVIPISECFIVTVRTYLKGVENMPQRYQDALDGVVESNQPLFIVGPRRV
jgi:hypothetical protein